MDFNTLHLGDNKDHLLAMVDSGIKVDLILTDPPYNIGKDFGNNTDRLHLTDFLNGLRERLSICRRLLKRDGSIILFCTHRYMGHIQLMLDEWFSYRRLMIWHYRNGLSRQTKEPVTEYDPFFWYSVSDEHFTWNGDIVRVPYRTDRVKNPVYKVDASGNKKAWYPNPLGAKRGDIWEYPTLAGKHYENERTEHPTQKPEAFITDLLRAFVPIDNHGKFDGVVLDPYAGSGTVPVCCEKLNLCGHNIKWIGMEMELKWHEISCSRIASILQQPKKVNMFA